jgi:hypothetical protein
LSSVFHLHLFSQLFVDALCRGGKPQRGRRIALKIDHIITIIIPWRFHQQAASCFVTWNCRAST